jgi:hypothetical protein
MIRLAHTLIDWATRPNVPSAQMCLLHSPNFELFAAKFSKQQEPTQQDEKLPAGDVARCFGYGDWIRTDTTAADTNTEL